MRVLIDRLRTGPAPYRFALAGVETDEFRTFDELRDDVDLQRFNGLVVSDSVRADLASQTGFVPFSDGYSWIPTP